MRKRGKGAIHRCRHDRDGIRREGRIWKVFHAPGFAEFRTIVAQSRHEFKQHAATESTGLLVQAGPKPFTDFLADRRVMDAADPNATFVQRDKS